MDLTAPAADVTAAEARRSVHDTRSFWRLLLAVVVPLPFLAKGAYYVLVPVDGDADFAATVGAFEAHRGLLETLKWLDAAFVVLLLPATVAIAWVARRGAPRLTTAGAAIALAGFLFGLSLLGGVETPALVTAQHDLDRSSMSALDRTLTHEPLLGLASLLFIAGVVLGLGLLGGALLRSRAVPVWAGLCVLLGGATHPFLPTHVGQGAGLWVAAVGCVGVSAALLRMPDDAFDLPPTP